MVLRQNLRNLIKCYVKAKVKSMNRVSSQVTGNVFKHKGTFYHVFNCDQLKISPI